MKIRINWQAAAGMAFSVGGVLLDYSHTAPAKYALPLAILGIVIQGVTKPIHHTSETPEATP